VYLLLQAVGGRMEQRLESGLLTGHAYAISNVRKVWPGARFWSHLTQNRSFRTRSSQPIFWLGTEKNRS